MSDYSAKLGSNKKCPVCGKTFFIPAWALDDYVYKSGSQKHYKYCCSYSCYSKTIDAYNQKLKSRKEMICK